MIDFTHTPPPPPFAKIGKSYTYIREEWEVASMAVLAAVVVSEGWSRIQWQKKHVLLYMFLLFTYYHRDYRGVALLSVEIEEHGDTMSTNERGPFLVGALGLSCSYKIFFFPWLL